MSIPSFDNLIKTNVCTSHYCAFDTPSMFKSHDVTKAHDALNMSSVNSLETTAEENWIKLANKYSSSDQFLLFESYYDIMFSHISESEEDLIHSVQQFQMGVYSSGDLVTINNNIIRDNRNVITIFQFCYRGFIFKGKFDYPSYLIDTNKPVITRISQFNKTNTQFMVTVSQGAYGEILRYWNVYGFTIQSLSDDLKKYEDPILHYCDEIDRTLYDSFLRNNKRPENWILHENRILTEDWKRYQLNKIQNISTVIKDLSLLEDWNKIFKI